MSHSHSESEPSEEEDVHTPQPIAAGTSSAAAATPVPAAAVAAPSSLYASGAHMVDMGSGGGRPTPSVFPAAQQPSNQPIVIANNVHKTYLLGVEGVPALRGVSVTINKGEFVLILGKSGGGKTSLLNIVGTIDKPTKGDLLICGTKITAKTTDAEFAGLRLRNIGFVFQTFNLISSMSARENVELPMILDGRLSSGERRARATELLTRVGIGARADHLPSQLSGGEQQRVTIARAVANKPDLLLLDEPTGDLDTKNSHIILSMLLELNRVQGITMLMVTHDQALKNYAHRVIHMVDGKIYKIEQISPEARLEAEQDLFERIKQDQVRSQAPVVSAPEIRDPDKVYQFHKSYAGQNGVHTHRHILPVTPAGDLYTTNVVPPS